MSTLFIDATLLSDSDVTSGLTAKYVVSASPTANSSLLNDEGASLIAHSHVSTADLTAQYVASASPTADSGLFAFVFFWMSSLDAGSEISADVTAAFAAGANLFGDSFALPTLGENFAGNATLFADSDVSAELPSDFEVVATLTGGSVVLATLGKHILVSTGLISNSSVTPDATAHYIVSKHITANSNVLADGGFPIGVAANPVANSILTGILEDYQFSAIANSVVTATLNEQYAAALTIVASATVSAGPAVAYVTTASILAGSSISALLLADLSAVAVSRTKIRLLFPAPMLDDANFNTPSAYTIRDANGAGIGVTSIHAENPPSPTAAALVLATSLQTNHSYFVTVDNSVQLAAGGSLVPNEAGFYWVQEAVTPIIIQLDEFTGEVSGGLFGNPDGQVFFSPALNDPAANSVIQVEDVDVCTYAFDSYVFPQPIDPPTLFTYGAANAFGSVLGPGGAVLWAPFPINMEAMFEVGFSPSDHYHHATDSSVTALLRSTWDPTYVALLNDPAWVLYAEQVVVPGTPPLFITANNAGPIPQGGETLLIVLLNLTGHSTFTASLTDVIALQAVIVADSYIFGQPLDTLISASSLFTASATLDLAVAALAIDGNSQVAASVT